MSDSADSFFGLAGFMPLIFIGIGVAVWRYVVLAQRKRHAVNRQWASTHGWQYTETDPALKQFSQKRPFQTGSAREAREVLWGKLRGWTMLSFTYTWTEGSGKNSTTYRIHLVAIQVGGSVPILDLAPDYAMLRMLGGLAGQDIEFESEEFNKQWRVSCDDLRFAHDVVHPRLMQYLLQPQFARRNFRYEGPYISTWINGNTNLDNIFPMAEVLLAMAEMLPKYLSDPDR